MIDDVRTLREIVGATVRNALLSDEERTEALVALDRIERRLTPTDRSWREEVSIVRRTLPRRVSDPCPCVVCRAHAALDLLEAQLQNAGLTR